MSSSPAKGKCSGTAKEGEFEKWFRDFHLEENNDPNLMSSLLSSKLYCT